MSSSHNYVLVKCHFAMDIIFLRSHITMQMWPFDKLFNSLCSFTSAVSSLWDHAGHMKPIYIGCLGTVSIQYIYIIIMITSWNGSIFRVTGHLCAGSPVNSPHKGQWRGAFMFSLICAGINRWVNNREASDLRRYRTHYDVIVMYQISWKSTSFRNL